MDRLLVVLYRQNISESNTLQSYFKNCASIHPFIKLVVWDNSPYPQSKEEICSAPIEFEYIHSPENKSLAYIYNEVLRKSVIDCKYIYLFDQDSEVTLNYFEEFQSAQQKYEHIDLFVPIVRHGGNIFSPCKEKWNRSFLFEDLTPGIFSAEHLRFILSGIALKNNVITEVQFDEQLKLYWIDNKFAYDYSKKYKELCVVDYTMQHDLSCFRYEPFRVKVKRWNSNVTGALYTASKMSLLAYVSTIIYSCFFYVKQVLVFLFWKMNGKVYDK